MCRARPKAVSQPGPAFPKLGLVGPSLRLRKAQSSGSWSWKPWAMAWATALLVVITWDILIGQGPLCTFPSPSYRTCSREFNICRILLHFPQVMPLHYIICVAAWSPLQSQPFLTLFTRSSRRSASLPNHLCPAKQVTLASGSYHFYDKVQSSACTPTSTQPKVIMINLTVGKSYETYFIPSPVLFHCPPSLISLSIHCCLASNSIAYPAIFHSCLASNFIAYPALFHSCLAFNFIAYPALFHFHFIPAWLLISLLFHSCLAFNFIAYPALFHCHFILAWLLISLPTQPYFIAISFLPGFWFHCLPSLISFPFHSCLAFDFIAYPALFHCYFIPAWPLISLPTQPYFISISFLPGFSFHCLPSLISFPFHSCLAFNFIAYPALFHCHFIPAWLFYFIAYPALFHCHFICISLFP